MTEKTSDPDATLARYAGGPAQLEAALHGIKESDLNFSPTSTSWTVRLSLP